MDLDTLGVTEASLNILAVLRTTGGVCNTDSMAELTTKQCQSSNTNYTAQRVA